MRLRTYVLAACLAPAALAGARADQLVLRPDTGGPTSVVNAVCFNPDGLRLYAGGFDKVVHVWTRPAADAPFDDRASDIVYRVPIGPDLQGTINAIAASPDGKWLAVGGLAMTSGRTDHRTVGMIFPALGGVTQDMLEEQGVIYVFDVKDQHAVRTLRGHAGTVLSLAFLPQRAGKPPLLVSAAEERTAGADAYTARLRLWDADAGKQLAETAIDTKAPRETPGLAAWWNAGPNAADVSVAAAWADGQVRVWNADTGKIDEAPDGGVRNNAVAAGAAPGRFLTASFQERNGVVQGWRHRPGAPPQLDAAPAALLRPEQNADKLYFIPRDLAAFSSGKKPGEIDCAVVVARRQHAEADNGTDSYFLLLLDLAQGAELGRYPLGPYQPHLSRVAASPDGKTVAVADGDRQQVLVFPVANLAGANPAPQTLRGMGTSFRHVAFARKRQGGDPGLLLTDDAGTKMVFDFNAPRLAAADAAWAEDVPDAAGWEAKVVNHDDGPTQVVVSGPGGKETTLDIGPSCSDFHRAFLPAAKGQPAGAVLALAYLDEFGQPVLALYDLPSGNRVRLLAGHTAAVRSVGFSGDGRFLVSTAGDQTVCLWSMTSLKQVLGAAGALPGVKVVDDAPNDRVRVVNAPTGGPLKEGARVEGLVEGNQLRRLTTARAFYTAFFNLKPDSRAVLRVLAPGAAQPEDVAVTVGQGTDERKPLLSLFVARDGEPAKRHWIAWTMFGPYEPSTPAAEKLLGWHFNPEPQAELLFGWRYRPDQHVAFIRADQYGKDYELSHFLRYVVREANAAEALKAYKADLKPGMVFWIDGVDPAAPVVDAGGGAGSLVRTRALTVKARLPSYPPEWVSSAEWRLDGGDWRPFGAAGDRTYSADLEGLAWDRGRHVVAVRLKADGDLRVLADEDTAFVYAPPPPRLELEWLKSIYPAASDGMLKAETQAPKYTLWAGADAGAKGEDVRFSVFRGPGKPDTAVKAAGEDLRQDVALNDGENLIEIHATNAGTTPALEAYETTVQRIRLDRFKAERTPEFSLRVQAPPNGPETPVRSDELIVVATPDVRILGTVKGKADLVELTQAGQPAAAFRPGTDREALIDYKIHLEKGQETRVSYAAKSARSAEQSAVVRLLYVPPLPEVRGVLPQGTVYEEEPEIRVALAPRPGQQPYKAEVLVRDAAQGEPQALGAGDRDFKVKVKLLPKSNPVRVRLTNEWGATFLSDPVQIAYARPPKIVTFDSGKADAARPELTAEVESPADLPPRVARVHNADGPLSDVVFRHDPPAEDRLGVEPAAGAPGRWKLTLRDVPLAPGDNHLRLTVGNEDGDCREPVDAVIHWTKPPPPPPVVAFTDFKERDLPINVYAPVQTLAFRVDSPTPLSRVDLTGPNGGPALFTAGPNAGKTLKAALPVRLSPREPTTFQLTALNAEGGTAEVSVTLQLVQQPAYVVIQGLRSLTPGGPSYPAAQNVNDGDGRAVIEGPVAEGRLELYGRIYWDAAADVPFQKRVAVRVTCNGLQQIPVATDPPVEGATECGFTATVLLTKAADNVIRVDLPEAKVAQGQRNACVVRRCVKPVSARRLHLVMIGIGKGDAEALQQDAEKAIHAGRDAMTNKLQALPVFEEVVEHKALVRPISKKMVLLYLERMKKEIEPKEPNAAVSDIVLIYYQGREVVNSHGDIALATTDSDLLGDPDELTVSCIDIRKEFGDWEGAGAQVVMFDAEGARGANGGDVAQAFDGSRLGVFNAFWVGGQAPGNRLFELLDASWMKAGNLGELAKNIEDLRDLRKLKMQFSYLPGDLAQLAFGGKP